jgi:hypothetical protein
MCMHGRTHHVLYFYQVQIYTYMMPTSPLGPTCQCGIMLTVTLNMFSSLHTKLRDSYDLTNMQREGTDPGL